VLRAQMLKVAAHYERMAGMADNLADDAAEPEPTAQPLEDG
jgi:hypothetical protein